MKIILNTFLVLSSLSTSQLSTANVGNEGAHGGGAVVCRDAQGKILSAELLDLYEGREEFGLTLMTSDDTVAQILSPIVERAKAMSARDFSRLYAEIQQVMSKKKMLANHIGLEPVVDSFPTIKPKDCKIEQLANYKGDSVVLIDGELWEHLNNDNRAALIVHEAVYKILRDRELVRNSRKARMIIAQLFSSATSDQLADWYSIQDLGSENQSVEIDSTTEVIVGPFIGSYDSSGLEKARKGAEDACAAWKNAALEDLGGQALAINCGTPRVSWLKRVPQRREGYYNIPQRCNFTSPFNTESKGESLGYRGSVTGTILFNFNRPTKYKGMYVTSEKKPYTMSDLASIILAHYGVEKSFKENCENWKNELRKSLGSHYIYATCNSSDLIMNDKNYSFHSEETICAEERPFIGTSSFSLLLTQ